MHFLTHPTVKEFYIFFSFWFSHQVIFERRFLWRPIKRLAAESKLPSKFYFEILKPNALSYLYLTSTFEKSDKPSFFIVLKTITVYVETQNWDTFFLGHWISLRTLRTVSSQSRSQCHLGPHLKLWANQIADVRPTLDTLSIPPTPMRFWWCFYFAVKWK